MSFIEMFETISQRILKIIIHFVKNSRFEKMFNNISIQIYEYRLLKDS